MGLPRNGSAGSDAPRQPVFLWSGKHFGFISADRLFDRGGRYRGWITGEGAVWLPDGQFLGELVDEHYVLRRATMRPPLRRIPPLPPIPAIPSVPELPRLPRIPKLGWVDALEEIG
jgi:hypothetical protein